LKNCVNSSNLNKTAVNSALELITKKNDALGTKTGQYNDIEGVVHTLEADHKWYSNFFASLYKET